MTAETMMFPLLVSPLWASGFRRRGIGIRCASASMCFQIMWSSQQTKTPEGPSNRSDWAFCPPGTVCQQFLICSQMATYLERADSPFCLLAHSISWLRDSDPNPARRMSSSDDQLNTTQALELTDLLSLLECFPCGILIRIGIIHLKRRIQGIIVTLPWSALLNIQKPRAYLINTDDVGNESVVLVCF